MITNANLASKRPETLIFTSDVKEEKISGPSHNALFPMGFFVKVVMWGDSDETYLKCKIGMSFDNLGMFYNYRLIWPPVQKNHIGSNALWDGPDIFSYMKVIDVSIIISEGN